MFTHRIARVFRGPLAGSLAIRETLAADVARARRLAPLVSVCVALIAFSGSAFAQVSGNALGQSLLTQTCGALSSPLVAFAFVIGILGIVGLLVFNEGKGLGARVVHLAIGAAVLLGIGTILSIIGISGNCSVV